jgi:hypothetical protein
MESKRAALLAAGALACLLVGASLEHVRVALAATVEEGEELAPQEGRARSATIYKSVAVTNDAAARASNEALRRRLAALEQELAKQSVKPAEQAEPRPPEVQRQGDGRSRRFPSSADMEKMKTENPEQYAEFQKRREEFRQSMEQRAQERSNFIAAVDTQRMTDDQRENHDRLVATVARLNEMRTQMEQEGFERTPEMRQEMGQLFESLGELYGSERRFLFEETARSVGYEGGQVSDFADQMQMIIDNTTMSGFGRHGGGSRDGGGRPEGSGQGR